MDVDQNKVPDVLEINKLDTERTKAEREYQSRMMEIQNKNKIEAKKLEVEMEKLKVARENQKNDLAIAKENAKGRNKTPKK